MAEENNNSFIPKRGPSRRSRSVPARQVYVFSLVSYVVFGATLVAAGGLFLYHQYIDRQMDTSVSELNSAIANFSEEEMDQVREFNARLIHAENRLNASVSIVDMLLSLEDSTANSSEFSQLTLERFGDESLTVATAISSDSFDSAAFQRELFANNTIIGDVTVDEITIAQASELSAADTISFTAVLDIPLTAIPYTVLIDSLPPATSTSTPDETETSTSTSASTATTTLPATEEEGGIATSTNDTSL